MKIICKLCYKQFKSISGLSAHITRVEPITTKEYYDKFLKQKDEGICLYCGQSTNFTGLGGYSRYCSINCVSNCPNLKRKRQQTTIKNYGVKNPSKSEFIKKKKENTCLKNWGCKCSLNNLEVRDKVKTTLLKNYGVDNSFKSEEIKQKIKKTTKFKYGVDANQLNPNIKSKSRSTSFKNWGVFEPLQSPIIRQKGKDTAIQKYKEYGVDHFSKTPQGRKICRQNQLARLKTLWGLDSTITIRTGITDVYCRKDYCSI